MAEVELSVQKVLENFQDREWKKYIRGFYSHHLSLDKEEVSLLVIGVHTFDNFVIPFLEADITRVPNRIDIELITNGESLENWSFGKRIRKTAVANRGKVLYTYSHNRIKASIAARSMDDFLATPPEIAQPAHDFFFIGGTYATSSNWRNLLYHGLARLKQQGIFSFIELDGSYRELEQGVSNDRFFHQIFPIQPGKDRRIIWPEVSCTNTTALRWQLLGLFDHIHQSPHIDVNTKESVTVADLRAWYHSNIIDTFGLKRQLQRFFERSHLGVDLLRNLDNFHKILRIFVCQGFVGFDPQTNTGNNRMVPEQIWRFSLLEKMQKIRGEDFRELGANTLDLLIQHDTFFPGFTQYLALVNWDGNKKDFTFPIYLGTSNKPNQETYPGQSLHQFFRLTGVAGNPQDEAFQLNQFLFKELQQNFPISIQLYDKEDEDLLCAIRASAQEHFTIDVTLTSSCEGKIHFFYNINEQKILERLDILLPAFYCLTNDTSGELRAEITCPDKNLFEDFDVAADDDEIKAVNFRFLELIRLQINQRTFRKYSKAYQKNTKFDLQDFSIENYGGSDHVGVKKILRLLGKGEDSVKHFFPQLVIFWYHVATLHLGSPGRRITFFPSSIFHDPQHEVSAKSYGGIILCEQLPNRGLLVNPIFQDLLQARDHNLVLASSLLFYKFNTEVNAKNDFIGQSLKAAVAAIMARNGSHGLGSHVLPTVAHLAQNPTDNQLLFAYLEQRLDFIAQVASEFPIWTFPAWFTSDMMMRFYQQREILTSIARTEKIGAYEFSEGEQALEIEWDPWLERKLRIADGQRIIVHGFVHSIERSRLEDRQQTMVRLQKRDPTTFSKSSAQETLTCTFFSEEQLPFRLGQQIRIKGVYIGSGKVEQCELIHHKLVIKTRKREFIDFDQLEVDQYERIDTSQAKPKSTYMNEAIDAGKRDGLTRLQSESEDEPVKIYGVILETYRRGDRVLKLLSVMDEAGLICELAEDFLDALSSDRIKVLHIGRRLIVEGNLQRQLSGTTDRSPEATELGFRLVNARVLEIVAINYLVGERLIQNSTDKLNKDVTIAIPGGVVGYQAFYTILENVIRNAAKHDWIQLDPEQNFGKNLEVKVELEEKEGKDFLICKVWTNAGDLRENGRFNNQTILDYDSYAGDSPTRSAIPVHHRINNIFTNYIIKESGELKKENLGITETKIAAGYLSQQNLRDIGYSADKVLLGNINNQDQGFIRASSVWELEEGKLVPRLGYKIKLKRQKECILIFSENLNVASRERLVRFFEKEDMGMTCVTFTQVENGECFPDYDFCVIWSEDPDHEVKECKLLACIRSIFDEADYNRGEPTEAMYALMEEIEYYPFRLFVVNDTFKEQIATRVGKTIFNKFFSFLKRRIVFLSREDLDGFMSAKDKQQFEQEHQQDAFSRREAFKLVLYDRWIGHFVSKKKKQILCMEIDLGLGENFNENRAYQDASIRGAFQTFKRFIVNQFIEKIEYSDPEAIRNYLEKREPNLSGEIKDGYLLMDWLGEHYNHYRFEQLRKIFNDFLTMYKHLYEKSLDQIETLPFIYRPSKMTHHLENDHLLQNKKWTSFLLPELRPHYWAAPGRVDLEGYTPLAPGASDKDWQLLPIGYVRHGNFNDDEYFYKDYLSGEQIFFSILKEYPFSADKLFTFNRLILQLYENPLPTVMIMDERVQDYVNTRGFRDKLANININIPLEFTVSFNGKSKKLLSADQHAEPLDEDQIATLPITLGKHRGQELTLAVTYKRKGFPQLAQKQQHRMKEKEDNPKPRFSNLVIHQALLEEISESCRNFIGEVDNRSLSFTDHFLQEMKLQHVPSIIVTSGKGKPDNLSPYAKFLPFSNIETFVLQSNPEKFLLTQILLKSIRKKEARHG